MSLQIDARVILAVVLIIAVTTLMIFGLIDRETGLAVLIGYGGGSLGMKLKPKDDEPLPPPSP